MIKLLTTFLTFFGGLYFFLEFLLPETISIPGTEGGFTFGTYHQEITRGVVLISTMAVGLGVINLCMMHGRIIARKSKGSLVSFFLLLGFFLTLVVLSNNWYRNETRQNSWNSTLALMNYSKRELAKENITTEELRTLREKIRTNIDILQAQTEAPEGVRIEQFRNSLSTISKDLSAKYQQERRRKATLPSSEELELEGELAGEEIDIPEEPEAHFILQKINTALTELSILRAASLADAAREHQGSFTKQTESVIIHGLFFPLGLSMFSLLAFYIAYAAYRSFRIRSIESAIMMCAAFVVILGQIPQGVLYISSDLPEIRLWLMQYLSTPAMRAIYFSSAIAGLSIAVRMWLSIDKNPISSK